MKDFNSYKTNESQEDKIHIVIICPVCNSTNIADDSTYQNNGLLGSGSRSWKTRDIRSCNDCGVVFKPTIGNGLI